VDFALNVTLNVLTKGELGLASAAKETLIGALNPAKTIQTAARVIGAASRYSRAAKGGNDVLVLGRREGLDKLAKEEGGRLSQTSSTSAKDIYKQNSGDIRRADRIVFNERNVPRTAEEAARLKGGEFARAERELILSRQDLLEKTTFINR